MLNKGKWETLNNALVGTKGITRPLIRQRIGPLKVLIGITNIMLQVSLSAMPLVLPASELSMLWEWCSSM